MQKTTEEKETWWDTFANHARHSSTWWWLIKLWNFINMTDMCFLQLSCWSCYLSRNFCLWIVFSYLVVDKVHNGMFQHLWGFRESLHCCGLVRLDLSGRNLHSFRHCLGEHGGSHTLRPGLVQLLVHVYKKKKKEIGSDLFFNFHMNNKLFL